MTRLAGKVALITGGGTGIGRAIALAFGREGAKVAVAGRRKEKLDETLRELEKQGSEGLAIVCDVAKARDAEKAATATVKKFGKFNVLVNNAGVLHVATIEGTSEEQWDKLMTINLKGLFLMCRAAMPEFRKAGGGAIVNIGSYWGWWR